MKKKKIFSLALTLSLVISTVFAGGEAVFAETADNAINAANAPAAKSAVVKIASAEEDAVTIPAENWNTVSELKQYTTSEYSSGKSIYYPVTIPKAGNFIFKIASSGFSYVGLFETKEDSEPLSAVQVPASNDISQPEYYTYSQRVDKPGTYYLVFSTSSYAAAQSLFTVGYIPDISTVAKTTLKSGKTHYASVVGTNYRYYKITTSGTRYLTISIPDRMSTTAKYKIKVMNYNKSSNLLKGTVTLDSRRDYKTYIGVPKGTYYVAVSTEENCYGLNVKSSSIKESSGSSKSSAKRLYKGSSKSGVITATQSSSSGDWYKFVLGSSQKVDLDVITKSGGYSGGIRVSFYDKNGRFGYYDYTYSDPSGTLNPYSVGYNGRLAKGTYYIKVQKYNSGSGYYKLKWS